MVLETQLKRKISQAMMRSRPPRPRAPDPAPWLAWRSPPWGSLGPWGSPKTNAGSTGKDPLPAPFWTPPAAPWTLPGSVHRSLGAPRAPRPPRAQDNPPGPHGRLPSKTHARPIAPYQSPRSQPTKMQQKTNDSQNIQHSYIIIEQLQGSPNTALPKTTLFVCALL